MYLSIGRNQVHLYFRLKSRYNEVHHHRSHAGSRGNVREMTGRSGHVEVRVLQRLLALDLMAVQSGNLGGNEVYEGLIHFFFSIPNA